MMRIAAALAVIAALAVAPVARAEPAPSRVLVLSLDDAEPYRLVVSGFQRAMKAKAPNTTVDVDLRRKGASSEIAGGEGIQLFFSVGASATQSCLRRAGDRAVLGALVLDAREIATAKNATVVMMEFSFETQFTWLRKFLPSAKRVGIIYRAEENEDRVRRARADAARFGIEVVAVAIESPRDIPGALSRLASSVDVLLGIPDSVVLAPETAQQLLLFSFRNRVPFIGPSTAWVKAGALYSLEWDYADIGAQSAELAVRVLGGARASSIPPEHSRKVLYSVNQKTVRHMRLDLPEALISGAKQAF